ncbi:uncharacterized protein LOC124166999 isoform X2 [Ischnura elegans]|uniref:uncharacterized protein LOC124166999 isoform X2 n=1 Tax=Ischnura elegans TaxID=197161 RepID=UPI001ED8AC05|nr:uncharacterized protein LOC124166999 isoform X2 [Ischnura elegans]
MAVPGYDKPFSLQTNNLPYPSVSTGLRNRWRQWHNHGYTELPGDNIEETSFITESEVLDIEPPSETVIDIPSELGVSESATSVLGTAGSAATSVLAETLFAAGAKAVYDRVSERGAVLPNSEFIGPGNPVHIGAAKNPSEQAAKIHDVNYSNLIDYAKKNYISQKDFTERVHQFDEEAIHQFETDWQSTGNWHAFAGKYGLKLNNVLEKAVGQSIYPSHFVK